jgi:hypothetical protein
MPPVYPIELTVRLFVRARSSAEAMARVAEWCEKMRTGGPGEGSWPESMLIEMHWYPREEPDNDPAEHWKD